jgi:type I restriction enzyme, S subunit
MSTWKTLRLIEVATLQRGFDLPVQNRTAGEIPILAANGPVGTHNIAKCSGPGVVTGRSGTIGKVHYVDQDYWPLNTSLFIKDFHGNHPRFIYYLLLWIKLERFHEGTGVPTLNRNIIHEVSVLIPPIAQQKRIAAILDKAEELRALRRKALGELDALARSVFLEMFGDPVVNSKKMELKMMDECAEKIQIGPFGTQLHEEDYVENGIPAINPTHIRNRKIFPDSCFTVSLEKYEQLSQYHLKFNDVILGRRGEMGRCASILESEAGWLCGTGSLFIRPRQELLNSIYLSFFLSSQSIKKYLEKVSQGVTMANLNKTIVGNIPVLLPPLSLQQEFTRRVEAIEQLKATHRASLTQLDALFASLQHRAFRGEL